MGQITVKGFILSQIKYRDHDRLCHLLTEDYGVITVKARNANRPKNPLQAATQFLVFGQFQLFFYKDRYTVNSAEIIHAFDKVQQSMEKLVVAAHLAEVFQDGLRDGLIETAYFKLWAYTMTALEQNQDFEWIQACAQYRFLCQLGFAPWTDSCVICQQENKLPLYFSFSKSAVICYTHKQDISQKIQDVYLNQSVLQLLIDLKTSALEKLFSHPIGEKSRQYFINFSNCYLEDKMEKQYSRLELLKGLADFTL